MQTPEPGPLSPFALARNRLLRQIRRIRGLTEELARLTLFLIDSQEDPSPAIDEWLKAEGFAEGPDGLLQPRPAWERLRRGETRETPELAYYWPASLKGDPVLRHHLFALRRLAKPMAQMVERLHGLPQYVYFQDAHNAVITYPFIDSEGIIPPDFDWKTYHPWKAAGPEANPERVFRWVAPAQDLGAQGAFVIGALPVYHGDECLGIWCMDIPLARLQQFLFPDPTPEMPPWFVVDTHGHIVLHPQLGPVIDPERRALTWRPLAALGGGFAQLNPVQLNTERRGQRHLIDGEGRMVEITFQALPGLDWILLGVTPHHIPHHPELAKPLPSPPDPAHYRKLLALCRSQADILTGWEQSYQTLVQRFSAVFFTLTPQFPSKELYVSPSIERLTGYPPQNFYTHPEFWRQLVIPEDLPEIDLKFQALLKGDTPLHNFYRIRTRDRETRWIQEEAVMIRDSQGNPLLVQGWLFDITPQKSIEESLRQREGEIHNLSNRLMELQEIERRNISSVLHDHMGQLLTLTRLEIESLATPPDDQPRQARCLALIDDALKTIRSLAASLHPSFLDDLDLPQILALVIDNFKSGSRLQIRLHCDPMPHPISGTLKTLFFRITGEALTNIVRHAGARQVDIRLTVQPQPPALVLTVDDDGHGFVAEPARRSGIGLIGMRERVRQAGGQFDLQSALGQGTHIRISIPYPAPGE